MSKIIGSGNGGAQPVNQACSACKHQRRKCTADCQLAPFFPAEQTKRFQSVHRVFGVCNILKLLNKLETFEEKQRAVDSLCWDASCRDRNPVDGSLGFFNLQMEEFKNERQEFITEREKLQKELAFARNQAQTYFGFYKHVLLQYSQATGISSAHYHQQLTDRCRQVAQNNPPFYVTQDAFAYPVAMSQAPLQFYHGAGIQQQGGTNSSVSGHFGVHTIGGAQRAEMMVPQLQEQHYTMIDTHSLTPMVPEEHKPPITQEI
ncbi:hypothetical protein SUGI_0288440 [Cryptomeria japonica]|uniref:LOB domain-containing protein 17 n=1 Tax=Cryptomeria japonica TaxID=3369 RepID=UPI002408DF63|nr:LOB domain-containing protein 17 [Cryptomeria japonica]GLJ16757.1 hypothetical protein SUGI_0288440 [Cryptomeria japonica]